MREHSDEIDRAAAGLRASRSPPPEVEARVFAALELRLAGPAPGGGGGDGGGGAAPVDAAWLAKVVGATAAMTTGGLALVRAGALVLGVASGPNEPSRVETVEPARALDQRDREQRRASNVVMHTSPPEPEPTRMHEPEPRVRVGPASTRARIDDASEIEAELALIREARARSDPDQALELLDEHARRFSKGALLDEREALRAIALCKLDRLAEARMIAAALIESRPRSPLIDRMRDACPALVAE